VVVLWLSQWNRDGPRARSRHEQQVGLAGFVPEHAFTVDPGGVIAKDPVAGGFCAAVGGFDLGAAGAAVDAHRDRQGPGQRVEADACQSRARASGRGRQRLPVPHSWAVSMSHGRRSRSPSRPGSGGVGSARAAALARRRSGSSRWSRRV
jgi:hypothetical protein